MTLASLIANDANIFDDLVSGTFTNPDASTRATTKMLKTGSHESLVTQNEFGVDVTTCRWTVPVSDMSTFVPARDGFFTDAAGNKWRIDGVELLTRGTRYSIDTTLEGGLALR